jgi:hypothetical protein
MSHALNPQPRNPAEITLINHQYLAAGCRPDPAMVWGTDVEVGELQDFVRRRNRNAGSMISTAHVLIRAVACSLARHRQLNCRVVRGRIYAFREINVRMVGYDKRSSDVNIITVSRADQATLEEIATSVWTSQLQIAQGRHADQSDHAMLNWGPTLTRHWASRLFWWLDRNFQLPRLGRIDRHLDSAVIVNYLGHADAPPMRMYKPSKFPDESSLLSVTMGRVETRPVVVGGQVVARPVAPLFVRADHRVTDAFALARFVATLRAYLANPVTMEASSDQPSRPSNVAA